MLIGWAKFGGAPSATIEGSHTASVTRAKRIGRHAYLTRLDGSIRPASATRTSGWREHAARVQANLDPRRRSADYWQEHLPVVSCRQRDGAGQLVPPHCGGWLCPHATVASG